MRGRRRGRPPAQPSSTRCTGTSHQAALSRRGGSAALGTRGLLPPAPSDWLGWTLAKAAVDPAEATSISIGAALQPWLPCYCSSSLGQNGYGP
eukprot:9469196-Pyramimonas_sp.AAC.2